MQASLSATPLPPVADSSWRLIGACGPDGGVALATAIGNLGATSDSVLLATVLRTVLSFRDASVLEAMRTLANNAAATPASRATAMHGMLLYHRPQAALTPPLQSLSLSPGEFCLGTMSYGRLGPAVGVPLPSDFRERIAATARIEANDPSGDPIVRAAAECLLSHLRHSVAPVIDVSLIRLTYMCGTKFRVRNPNAVTVLVAYDVYNTPERRKLYVPAGRDEFFFTQNTGTVRLFHEGTLIETKANGHTPCP